jgi:hypothetical protein
MSSTMVFFLRASKQRARNHVPGDLVEQDEAAEFRGFLAMDREHVGQGPVVHRMAEDRDANQDPVTIETVAEARGGVVARVMVLLDEDLRDLVREDLRHLVFRGADHFTGRAPAGPAFLPALVEHGLRPHPALGLVDRVDLAQVAAMLIVVLEFLLETLALALRGVDDQFHALALAALARDVVAAREVAFLEVRVGIELFLADAVSVDRWVDVLALAVAAAADLIFGRQLHFDLAGLRI